MRIIAFDLSLTRSGWAGPHLELSGVLVPPRGQDRGIPRLRWIRDQVAQHASLADLVVLEGYAFGVARGNALTQLGELGGVIRVMLHEAGIPFVDVAPATLKQYAIGRGNATKAQVLVEAVRRLGYGGSDDNEADALWLLAMARDHYDVGDRSLVPKAQRERLAKVEWPNATFRLAS